MTQRRRTPRRRRRVRGGGSFWRVSAACSAQPGAFFLQRPAGPPGCLLPPLFRKQTLPCPAESGGPSGSAIWIWPPWTFRLRSAFRAGAAALMDNCLSLGLNTVLVQVRPFGDALYRSSLFPWSHLCTGVQGQDPGSTRWTSC